MRPKLIGEDRRNAIAALQGWAEAPGRDAIAKTFLFENFSAAWGFMCRAALVAERMDHHPEWFNVYRKVDVTLSTHDSGGVTDLDIRLAASMDEIAANAGASVREG